MVQGVGSRASLATLGSWTPTGRCWPLDVDGVISLFGFEGPISGAPGRFHLINGMAHCIPDGIGGMLERLASSYEIVWATGWEDRANERLPDILGLPGQLPFLTFDGRARFGTAHWKIDALDRYAGERASGVGRRLD